MNGWSIPPLMLAAVNVYVAVHYIAISMRTRRSRELLMFAFLALSVGLYNVCCAMLYSSTAPAEGRPWQLAQLATLTLGAAALLLFTAEYTGRTAGRFSAALVCAYALVWIAVVAAGSDLLVGRVPAVKHVAVPWVGHVTYNETGTGPLAPALNLLALAAFGYVFWAGLLQYREGQRRRALHLLVATGVLFLAAVNDAALGLGLIRSVYVIEYAFVGMVILMSDSLSGELVEAMRVQEALARSEQRFRSMVQQSYDLITVVDVEGTITYATPSAERILGYGPSGLVGHDAFELVHPEDVAHVRAALERTAGGRATGISIEFRVRHANGSWIHLEGIGSSQLGHPEIRGVVLNSRDVSERKRAEEEIRRTLRELKVLNAVSQAAVAIEDEETLIERATEIVRVALFPDDCGVLMLDDTTRTLRYTASYRLASSAEDRSPIPLGVGITGTVAATARIVRVDDATADSRYLARLPGMRSELCVPLMLGDTVIGVLNAESRAVGAFSEGDERVLSTVAGQLATAIGRLRAAAAHRESEDRFRRLAESAFEGIGIHDRGRIVDVNLRLAEMLGYDPTELIGRHVMEFVAPESADDVAEFMRLGTDEAYEHLALRSDGTSFPVETQGKPLSIRDSSLRVAAVRDITERKQAEERIRRQLERLAALRAIDSTITTGPDLETTMGVVLDMAVTQLHVHAAVVLRVDGDGRTLAPASWRGFSSDGAPHGAVPFGECRSGRAAAERRPVLVQDIRTEDGGTCRACAKLVEEGFRSSYCAPLVVKDTVYGVLEVFRRSPQDIDDEWVAFLETLAGQLAIAIDNRLLLERLAHSNAELARAYDTTLEGWSRALELRDRETQGHSARVVELTLRVARTMGFDGDALAVMRRGALLHDIGKMGIPDSILLKEGPLTPEQWATMRRHPQLAYDLLYPIDYLRPALDIPYCHHEHWDGNGYPRGLKGEDIPMAARIFAVVDAWDGLSSPRPYRAAWPPERVRAYLKEKAGAQFDPEVVATFLRVVAV